MADVFISYAREDSDFAYRLNDAFKSRQCSTSIDVLDILPAEEWPSRVESLIAGSDSFLFVISPDSVGSQACREEIACSVKFNKRLIPVVARQIRDSDAPPEIASINWLFLRQEDDFEQGLQALTQILRTNPTWVRAHSRLTERALEWEGRNKDASFLLRGQDLEDAQAWLSEAPGMEPSPTRQQTDFINAGVVAEKRRQRRTILTLVIFSLVAAGLAIWAELNRREAVRQRNVAESERQIAVGRQLAAQAELERQQEPQLLERSGLLAVEALRRLDAQGMRSLAADKVARQVLSLLPRRPVLRVKHSFRSLNADFSGDGRYLATGGGVENSLNIWSASGSSDAAEMQPAGIFMDAVFASGSRLVTQSREGPVEIWDRTDGHRVKEIAHDSLFAMAISPDGRLLGATIPEGVVLWEISTGQEVARIEKAGVRGVQFSPDSTRLAIGVGRSSVSLWEIASAKELWSRTIGRSPQAFAFDRDGTKLAIVGGDDLVPGMVTVLSAQSGDRLADMEGHTSIVWNVAFSPDGESLGTASWDRSARIWSVASGEQLQKLKMDAHVSRGSKLAFSPDGRYLIVHGGTFGGSAKVAEAWETASGSKASWTTGLGDIGSIAFHPQANSVAIASPQSGLTVLDLTEESQLAAFRHSGAVVAAFAPDGSYLAAAGAGTTRVWELESNERVAEFSHLPQVEALLFDPDGSSLAVSSWTHTAEIHDLSGNQTRRLPHSSLVRAVALNADASLAAIAGADNTVVWDLATGKPRFEASHEGRAWVMDFSSNGAYLAMAGQDGRVAIVVDTATGKTRTRLTHDADLRSIRFSQDSRHLVTAAGLQARVWDAESGEAIAAMAHDDGLFKAVLAPDGQLVATASKDKTARIWDAATGRELHRLRHDGEVWDVAFSPDGKYLATASQDRTARVWDARTGREVTRINHELGVPALAFSPDSNYLATAGDDAIGRISMLPEGRELQRFNEMFGLESVTYSASGSYIAWTANEGTWIYDIGSVGAGEVVRLNHEDGITALAFRPDGHRLASIDRGGVGHLWETQSGRELAREPLALGEVSSLRFAPGGKSVLMESRDGPWFWEPERLRGSEHTMQVETAAVNFSHNGRFQATAYTYGTVVVEQCEDGHEIAQIDNPADRIRSVFISPDGRSLLTASIEHAIRLWDTKSRSELASTVATTGAEGANDYVQAAFLEDGVYVVMAGPYELRVWEARSDREIGRAERDGKIRAVAMSPDQAYFALGNDDGSAEVWSMQSGQLVSKMQRHAGDVVALAFDPESRYLATASGLGREDRTARVWEVASGREIVRLRHDQTVDAVAFSPDGRYLASGGGDGIVRLWYWLPQDLIEEACARLTRNLYPFEQANYLPKEEDYEPTCKNLPLTSR